VNEIFYDFSCYDALDFEILCIRRVRDTLKELFLLDIKNSRFTESEVTERMKRFLNLMLIARYCQLAETLGATAIAFLNTKIKGSNIVHSKEEEQQLVLNTLSSYYVGDVINFYSKIRDGKTSYVANLLGYPPLSWQGQKEREVLEKSCATVKDHLDSVGSYYRLFVDIYNAYKHGYRTISTTINNSDEGILAVKDNGEPALLKLDLRDIDKMFERSTNCRSLLQDIIENHKLAMRISYDNDRNINLNIYLRKEDVQERFPLHLIYPSREDLMKETKEAEKSVLKKIQNIEDYQGYYILLDLDLEKILFSDKNMQKVIEHYNSLGDNEPDNGHRRTITRLTEKYLADLDI
jgi:hypothetical protein